MKRYLTLFLIVLLALTATACTGTGTDATKSSADLEGLWVYEAPASQDPSYVVNFTTGEDNTFTMEINSNTAQAEQATANTANFSGTYTAGDGTLELEVDQVEDPTAILTGVENGSKLELTYELSADNDVVTINDLSNYVKDLPSSIEMQKSNQ